MSPLVAGREPAKSATDASSREAPFSSWLGRLFTHRFSRRAELFYWVLRRTGAAGRPAGALGLREVNSYSV